MPEMAKEVSSPLKCEIHSNEILVQHDQSGKVCLADFRAENTGFDGLAEHCVQFVQADFALFLPGQLDLVLLI